MVYKIFMTLLHCAANIFFDAILQNLSEFCKFIHFARCYCSLCKHTSSVYIVRPASTTFNNSFVVKTILFGKVLILLVHLSLCTTS